MLTVPHCFHSNIWYKDYDYDKIDNLVDTMRKPSNKGLLLYVSGQEERTLVVSILK